MDDKVSASRNSQPVKADEREQPPTHARIMLPIVWSCFRRRIVAAFGIFGSSVMVSLRMLVRTSRWIYHRPIDVCRCSVE